MSLSPALFTALVSDGFRVPAPAAALAAGFQAGDLVVVGADLVGQAANDSGWDGAPTARASSLNLVGLITVPKGSAEVIPAGAKIAINVTNGTNATTGNVATAVAVNGTNGPTTGTNYPLGISPNGAGADTTSVTVLMWPGSGLGS